MALELLKKAEAYTDEGDRYRAVTYNNFACIFRRTKKLRSALSFLEKALEIEGNDCTIYMNYAIVLFNRGYKNLAFELFQKSESILEDIEDEDREPEMLEQR